MRLKNIITAILLTTVTGICSTATAQSDFETNVEFRSVGISVGSYSPSFDYFDRTFWNFDGGAALGLESELSIMPIMGLKTGVSYFTTSANVTRGEFASEETLEYTLIPFSLALVGRYDLPEFSVSFSPGIDIYHIGSSYTGSSGTQGTRGNSTGVNLAAGIERKFGVLGVELFGKYLFGSFDQEMQFGPDLPVTTETIDLNGFKAGLTLKYLY